MPNPEWFTLPPVEIFVIPQKSLFRTAKMRFYAESHLVFLTQDRKMGFRITTHLLRKSAVSGMTKFGEEW
jgi:hypothetical protein